MDDQHHPEAPKPTVRRFQFGMKVLFALPIGVAVFFAIATYVGFELAAMLLVLAGIIVCSLRPATRPISCGLALLLAVLVSLMLGAFYNRVIIPAMINSECSHQVRMISMALQGYHDTHGSFPPAYIADENGRPMHSWRVLILPYLDQDNIYGRYNFDEPWDGPNNSKLAAQMPYYFQCLLDPAKGGPQTSFVAVVGPRTVWSGSEQLSLDDFADDPSETLMVVEIANSGIHWMEPRDLNISEMTLEVNPKNGRGISSRHAGFKFPRELGGANVGFADGSVRFLPETTLPEDLRAMLTRSGGESVDLEGF
jgi:prepilin-type processing-associated H-X9-DG protein